MIILQLLTSDWTVHIPEEDQPDGYENEIGSYLSVSQVNEIEMELLKEKLHEMYLQAEGQEVLPEEVRERVPFSLVRKDRHQRGGTVCVDMVTSQIISRS